MIDEREKRRTRWEGTKHLIYVLPGQPYSASSALLGRPSIAHPQSAPPSNLTEMHRKSLGASDKEQYGSLPTVKGWIEEKITSSEGSGHRPAETAQRRQRLGRIDGSGFDWNRPSLRRYEKPNN